MYKNGVAYSQSEDHKPEIENEKLEFIKLKGG